LKNNIVLIGFQFCGKTTFGQKMAKALNCQFIDTDLLIGSDCRALYKEKGKSFFRRKEKEAVQTLKKCHHCIIATGGGSVLDDDNVDVFKKIGLIMYLYVDKKTIKNRIYQKGIPAFLDEKKRGISFEKMYEEREPLYRSLATVIVDCSSTPSL
jgi:shikimate kinase